MLQYPGREPKRPRAHKLALEALEDGLWSKWYWDSDAQIERYLRKACVLVSDHHFLTKKET